MMFSVISTTISVSGNYKGKDFLNLKFSKQRKRAVGPWSIFVPASFFDEKFYKMFTRGKKQGAGLVVCKLLKVMETLRSST